MTRLKELRQEKGLRILDVTCATKIHSSTLSQIERGRLAVPIQTMGVICKFFGVDKDVLFDKNRIAV